MPSDDIAEAVAQRMREEDEILDPRLERYALGTLPANEMRALEAAAEHDPELRVQLELHAPLSDELRHRLTHIAQLASQRAPPRRMTWVMLPVGALAAAAAVFVVVLPSIGPRALPDYELTATQAPSVWRSEPTSEDSRALPADLKLRVLLRPATSVPGVAARLEAKGAGAPFTPTVTPVISRDGSVLWEGRADAFTGGRTGRFTLTAVVGHPGSLPPREQTAESRNQPTSD